MGQGAVGLMDLLGDVCLEGAGAVFKHSRYKSAGVQQGGCFGGCAVPLMQVQAGLVQLVRLRVVCSVQILVCCCLAPGLFAAGLPCRCLE